MKEIMYLLIIFVVLAIVLFISFFWNTRTKSDIFKSELHARDRYAIAERIEQELKEKQSPQMSKQWDRNQTKKHYLVL